MFLPLFSLIVPAFGITGGIRSGVANFGTAVGSSVPPGIAASDTVGATSFPPTIPGDPEGPVDVELPLPLPQPAREKVSIITATGIIQLR